VRRRDRPATRSLAPGPRRIIALEADDPKCVGQAKGVDDFGRRGEERDDLHAPIVVVAGLSRTYLAALAGAEHR
jgi:hypothetical protein